MKIRLNVSTIDGLRQQAPRAFDWIGFDPIDNCNLHCVYCHNKRTKKSLEIGDLECFLKENVISIRQLQVGCVMEPTLDKRMVEMIEVIGRSDKRPSGPFGLYTNATLLHTHDQERMIAAGINVLSVSIDSSNPETFKQLRGGAKLEKALNNIAAFSSAFPDIPVHFYPTVSTANVDEMDALVESGLSRGVSFFGFREMFYYPTSNIVDHKQMLKLVLPDGAFAKMADRISSKYGHLAELKFLHENHHKPAREEISENSRPAERTGRQW